MKKIITLALAAFGAIGVANATPSGQVNFSGLVTTNCTFTNLTQGSLTASGNGSGYNLGTGTVPGNGNAYFDLAYGGTPTISIDAVTQFSASPLNVPTLTDLTTGIYFQNPDNDAEALAAGAHSFSTGTKSFTLSGNTTTDGVAVLMNATAATAFPVGDYAAQTTITCQ